MLKKVIYLLIACGVAICAVFIRQFSDSDRPLTHYAVIGENEYKLKFPIVSEGKDECLVDFEIPDSSVTGKLHYRLANSSMTWKSQSMVRTGNTLVTMIPPFKPNVKITYYIELTKNGTTIAVAKNNPVWLRYQRVVPKYISYPYDFLYLLIVLLLIYVCILAIYNIRTYAKYLRASFYISVGVILFSFVIHLVSFRHVFLAFDPHNNLTFYKDLVAFLFLYFIFKMRQKPKARFLIIGIPLLVLLLYCIPQHVMFSMFYR